MARSRLGFAAATAFLFVSCSSQSDTTPNLGGVPEDDLGGGAGSGGRASGSGGSGGSRGGGGGAGGAAGVGNEPGDAAAGGGGAGGAAGADAGGDGRGGAGGGARDAGPPDSQPSVPMIDCKVAKFCDDFEAYDVGGVPRAPWTTSKSSRTTLTIDTSKAFSGTKSVKFTSPMSVNGTGGTGSALIRLGKPVLPMADNLIYGRMMTYLTASPAGGVHWTSMRASGSGLSYSYGAMYQRFLANYNPHDCYKGSRTAWPVGKWACLQWQFDGSKNAAGDGNKNEMRLWMDGVAIADQTVIRFGQGCVDGTKSEWIAPQFTTLSLGWENYQQSPIPIEMWIDDVAVSDKPIACPTK